MSINSCPWGDTPLASKKHHIKLFTLIHLCVFFELGIFFALGCGNFRFDFGNSIKEGICFFFNFICGSLVPYPLSAFFLGVGLNFAVVNVVAFFNAAIGVVDFDKHLPKAVQNFFTHVQCEHGDKHQIHQTDEFLPRGFFCSCHFLLAYLLDMALSIPP